MQKTKLKQTEIGMIPEDWEVEEIGEVAEVVGGGTPSTKISEYWDGDIAWITPRDLSTFKFRYIKRGERNITKKGLENSSAKLLPKETVLLTTRAPVGYLAIADNQVTTNQGFRSLIPNDKTISEFLFYLLKKNVEILKSNASGTTFGELSGSRLKALQFAFPNVEEQSSIAKILSSLDSKIELNQQMNKTLEAIGQAIFKHWFIDFEFPNEKGKPYKSSGGEMVDSELGEIPKGWEVNELGEFIEFVKGRKPNQVFGNDEDGLMPQILIDVLDGGTPFFSNSENMVQSDETDIIMVMDGASSGRTERGFAGILGSTLAKIKVKELNQDYVYCLLKIKEDDIKQNTTGTSIPHADKKKIEKYLIAVPPKKILEDFRINFNQILFRQILIRKENKNLSQIRDSLLPKLMSGKIRVPVEVRA